MHDSDEFEAEKSYVLAKDQAGDGRAAVENEVAEDVVAGDLGDRLVALRLEEVEDDFNAKQNIYGQL